MTEQPDDTNQPPTDTASQQAFRRYANSVLEEHEIEAIADRVAAILKRREQQPDPRRQSPE